MAWGDSEELIFLGSPLDFSQIVLASSITPDYGATLHFLGENKDETLAKLEATVEKWERVKRGTRVFTKRHREARKNARKARKELRAYSKAHGHKLFSWSPKESPTELWKMDPKSRPISPAGLMGVTQKIIALAKGARPLSARYLRLEMRSSIRGGLSALQAAGIIKGKNPDALKSKMWQSEKKDKQLCSFVKAKSIPEAYYKVRKLVDQHNLEKLAWACRALYILQADRGFSIAKSIGMAGAAIGSAAGWLIPPVGLTMTAITTTVGVKWSIDKMLLSSVAEDFNEMVEQARNELQQKFKNLEIRQELQDQMDAEEESIPDSVVESNVAHTPVPDYTNSILIGAGAIGLMSIVFLVSRGKQE